MLSQILMTIHNIGSKKLLKCSCNARIDDEDEPYCPAQFLSYFSALEYVQIMIDSKKFKNAEIEIVARTTTYEVV